MLSQFLDSGVQSHFFADESSFFCQRSYFFGCANHDYIRPDYTHRGWGPKKGNSPEIRKRKLIKYIDTFLHFSFSIHNFVHLDEVAIDVTWHIVQLSLTVLLLPFAHLSERFKNWWKWPSLPPPFPTEEKIPSEMGVAPLYTLLTLLTLLILLTLLTWICTFNFPDPNDFCAVSCS